MKYEEFIAALCQKIREVTKGWNGTSIEFRTTPQNNGRTLDLLVVSKQGKKMNGTYELSFHTQELYEALAFDKMDLKHILRIVESKLRQAGEVGKISPLEVADDYEQIRSHLIIRPINFLKHMEKLKDGMYDLIGDIALTVYIHIGFVNGAYVSSAVSSEYLEIWNKGKEEVIKEAFTNTYNLFPPIMLTGLEAYSVMDTDIFQKDAGYDMVGVTNEVIFNGAVSIFLPGVAKKLSDILGEDLYIVFLNYDYAVIHPVSIIRPEEIRSLIASVNSDSPDEEGFLSDMIFTYRRDSDKMEVVKEVYS